MNTLDVDHPQPIPALLGRYMTVAEAAGVIGCTVRNIRYLCHRHGLAEWVLGRWLIDRGKFAAYLRTRAGSGDDAAR
jgi:hypothetical protein